MKKYLDFLAATKDVFFGYLYHRTGSVAMAKTVLAEVYLDALMRATRLWWFGTLNLKLVMDAADDVLREKSVTDADIGTAYLPNLVWLSETERQSAATLHDALWSLPRDTQRILILSLLIGLSDERIAEVLRGKPETVSKQLNTAKELLLARWQPTAEVAAKLQSLVFAPALDAETENAVRFSVIEKYNALRFRRYQWAVIGGLFAVMSNVIVASVLAFAVVTQPPSSLRGVRTQVASLDAVLLQRQAALNDAKQSLAVSFKEAERLAAYDVSRDMTALGLASALESLHAEQDQEEEVNTIIRLMRTVGTAMAPVVEPVLRLASRYLLGV